MAYLNITADLSAEGRRKIKEGQMLVFDFEGSPVYLLVMRKSKVGVWAKRLKAELVMQPDEADEKVSIIPKII